jgi:hypothetical protein
MCFSVHGRREWTLIHFFLSRFSRVAAVQVCQHVYISFLILTVTNYTYNGMCNETVYFAATLTVTCIRSRNFVPEVCA